MTYKLTPKQCDILAKLRDGETVVAYGGQVAALIRMNLVQRSGPAGLALTEHGRAEVGPAKMTYLPRLRPASFATLPAGIKWEYVAAPWDLAHVRTDIPRAANRHGIIRTDRPLTAEERERFDLELSP